MKKYILFGLMAIFPLMSVAAPSVRMLGGKTGTPASVTKANPVKFTVSEPQGTANTSARVGTTMRVQKNRALGGVSGAVTSGGTRFPVINIPKVNESADLPKVNGTTNNTTIISGGTCDCPSVEDDPRVDMIKVGQPDGLWTSNTRTNDAIAEDGGRVWMWIEVDD